uniref:Apoptotic chromatin condensation inducer 1 n=1 Tax=Rousettus aegyptiacus TaxID=9407 RepID=A0A7J8IFJ4_ROUAE|nr:apoptotic chromatin condensation inducer 1 [Rousettus aegyptiacus]
MRCQNPLCLLQTKSAMMTAQRVVLKMRRRKRARCPNHSRGRSPLSQLPRGYQLETVTQRGASLVGSGVGEPAQPPHRRNPPSVSPLNHSRASSPTSNPWRGRRLSWIFMLMTPESLRMRQNVMVTMGPMTKG